MKPQSQCQWKRMQDEWKWMEMRRLIKNIVSDSDKYYYAEENSQIVKAKTFPLTLNYFL